MKSIKFFSAALALALTLTGCQPEVISGVDANSPAPKDLAIDAEVTTSTVLAVTWDATECVKAGVKSFTVQAATAAGLNSSYGVYDTDHTQTVMAADTVNIYSAKYSELVPGEYSVRVRANYPRSVYSEWVYLQSGADTTYTGVTLPAPSFGKHTAAAKSITVAIEKKSADYIKKFGISGIEVQYKEKAAAEWTSFGRHAADASAITIDEGIKALTTYVVRVRYINAKYQSDWATSDDIVTLEAKDFTIKTADELVALFNDEVTAAMTVVIANDLDFTGKTLKSIDFPGTLKGENHVIKNLTTSAPLFNSVSGTVSDLTLDSSCKFTTGASSFANFTSLVSGTGKLVNITNKADLKVTLASAPTAGLVAGLVSTNKGTMEGCVNEGKITVENTGDIASNSVIVLAGVVAHTDGALTDCKNKGAVTLASSGFQVAGALVGGVAGYANASVTGCSNEGAISGTIKDSWIGAKADGYPSFYVNALRVTFHLAGVVTVTDIAGTITNCNNSGAINYFVEDISATPASIGTNRPYIAGIVASRAADVKDCKNTGKLVVKAITPTRVNYNTNNYIIGVGGIAGADQGTTQTYNDAANKSNVENCVNEGDIEVEFDNDKSNATIGGICPYPGPELETSECSIIGCTNRGNIIASGTGKFRMGGIAGGLGVVKNCKNYGTIKCNVSSSGSAVGGISGFHSQALAFSGNENYGEVIAANSSVTCYCAALVGSNGAVDATKGENCIASGKVTTVAKDAAKYTGIVVGGCTTASGTKVVTWGTADAPIQIKNLVLSIGGVETAITADNMATYYMGTNTTQPFAFNCVVK